MSVRLKWPLEVTADGTLAVLEQDSPAEIAQCLRAIAKTSPGARTDFPEMGLPDPAFAELPLDADGLAEVLERHEVRAEVLAYTAPDVVDEVLEEIRLDWSPAIDGPNT